MSIIMAVSVALSAIGVGAGASGAQQREATGPSSFAEASAVAELRGRPHSPRRVVAGRARVRLALTGHRLAGIATWYGTGPGRGEAAAGPALRRALGVRWRNSRVQVCRLGRCVLVRISDWCRCDGGRLIDLSDEDFSRLAPLWRGVITVRVVG